MNEILRDPSIPELTGAIESNVFAFFSLFRRWPAAELHDEPDAMWSLTDVPFPLFNSVLRARIADEQVDAVVDAAIGRCRSRGVPMLWWTGPATRPVDLPARLLARGFVHEVDAPGMAIDLSAPAAVPPAVAGLTVERVVGARSLQPWCDVAVAGFGMPEFVGPHFFDLFSSIGLADDEPVRHYLGRLDGEAVAAATLFLGAGVAGIYDVATIPAARQRGIGAAMTRHGLADARAAGYHFGILQSSAMGAPVYRRLGFREYCTIGQYLWTGDAPARDHG
jgi:GNAT superfamily N-acetyltransferase